MEGLILSHTALRSTYSLVHHGYFGAYNPAYYLWDADLHTICYYNGYTVNDCSQFGAIWDEDLKWLRYLRMRKDRIYRIDTKEW